MLEAIAGNIAWQVEITKKHLYILPEDIKAINKKGSIIGANALVTSGTIVPENSLVLGVPAKVVKQDVQFEQQAIKNAETYIQIRKNYLENIYPRYNVHKK